MKINTSTETDGAVTTTFITVPLPDGTTLDLMVQVTEGRSPDTLNISASRGWVRLVDTTVNIR